MLVLLVIWCKGIFSGKKVIKKVNQITYEFQCLIPILKSTCGYFVSVERAVKTTKRESNVVGFLIVSGTFDFLINIGKELRNICIQSEMSVPYGTTQPYDRIRRVQREI